MSTCLPQDKNLSLEKENQLLRKELSKHSGANVRPGGQVSCVQFRYTVHVWVGHLISVGNWIHIVVLQY